MSRARVHYGVQSTTTCGIVVHPELNSIDWNDITCRKCWSLYAIYNKKRPYCDIKLAQLFIELKLTESDKYITSTPKPEYVE